MNRQPGEAASQREPDTPRVGRAAACGPCVRPPLPGRHAPRSETPRTDVHTPSDRRSLSPTRPPPHRAAAPAPGADGRPCGDPEAPCAFAVINAPVRSPRMEAERWEGKRRNATGSAPAARRGLLPRTPSVRRTEVWGRHPLGFHVQIAPA